MSAARCLAVLAMLVLAFVGAAIPGCASVSSRSLHRDTRLLQEPHVAATALKATTGNGAISVREGNDQVVRVSATIRAQTPERAAAAAVWTRRTPEGVLTVGVDWPDGKRLSNEGCDLEITMPAAHGVELRTTNGAIELSGMAGPAVLTTGNGAITVVGHGGDVEAETSNAAVRVTRAAGRVRVRTSNGQVRVEDAASAADVESSNGAVEIGMLEGAPGPVRVRTDNGSVSLRLGKAFRGELVLKTSNGKVDVAGAPAATTVTKSGTTARLRFGEGNGGAGEGIPGEASSIQTSNGSITVTSRGR